MRTSVSRLFLIVFVLALLAAHLPADASDVVIIGPKGERRFAAADLAALPQVKVTVSDHGTPATFEGVVLQTLLEQVGAPTGEHLRGKELAKYVVVEGRDGYRAVLSLAELSAAFSDQKVLLASRREGKTLSDGEGPFRVVVEGDKRMGRCVRQVKTVRIAEAE